MLRALLSLVLLLAAGLAVRAAEDGDRSGKDAWTASEILASVRNAPKGNEARSRRLAELFRRAGVPAGGIRIQEFSYRQADWRNLVVWLPGSEKDGGVIVLGAHTDTARNSPGIIDNWSGCVTLAALYREIAARRPKQTFCFVGFGCEEHGQAGSQVFLQRLDRVRRARLGCMINLECLGVDRLRTWANESADELESIFHRAAANAEVPTDRQVLFGFSADSMTFTRAQVPAMTIHSLGRADLALINTPADDGARLSLDRLSGQHKALAAFLMRLDARGGGIDGHDREGDLSPVRSHARPRRERAGYGGVPLEEVRERGAEYLAGLREGDVIVDIQGVPVYNAEEFRAALLTFHSGQTVRCRVRTPSAARKAGPVAWCVRRALPPSRPANAAEPPVRQAMAEILPMTAPTETREITIVY